MDYVTLQYDFLNSASIRLLRSQHAPLILSFLFAQFKVSQRVSVPLDDLVGSLEMLLLEINTTKPDAFPKSASVYLKDWSNEEHRFLRVLNRNNTDLVELTADTERCLAWVETLYQHQFVGTESRFLSIFALLQEMISRSTEDVSVRVSQLEQQRDAIQTEIDLILEQNRVEPFSDTQLRERFWQASDLARDLLRDFAAIEQNFRGLARTLQERQMQPDSRKGTLIGFVLDADSELKQSDQGKSFYAFWEFLSSESKREELRSMLEIVYALPALQDISKEQDLLRRIIRHLGEAGEKVVQSNQRLSEQLRRLLDERSLAERRRVRELLSEIKHLALQNSTEALSLEVDGDPAINFPLERSLWEASKVQKLEVRPQVANVVDAADPIFQELYQQFWVNEAELEHHLEVVLAQKDSCSLLEVLEVFPLTQGLPEVLGYMAIAGRGAQHSLDYNMNSLLSWRAKDNLQHWRVPLLTFRRT
jgi:hypothetical protein